MNLVVNGEALEIPAPMSVATLLESRGLAGKRVAVERNGEIVPGACMAKPSWQRATR